MPSVTTSPAFRYWGFGFMPMPTPGGVPVVMTSPGSSVMYFDVSERDFQLKKSASQWNKGKGCDTFGPLGPWLVTTDEIKDPQNLDMWLDVNGVRKQTGNTKTMIFTIAELVADVSKYMTLLPGDVVTTGTPPGVGMGMKPQQWLKAGDVITLAIQGLGEQKQKVVPFKGKR